MQVCLDCANFGTGHICVSSLGADIGVLAISCCAARAFYAGQNVVCYYSVTVLQRRNKHSNTEL